MKTIVIGYDDTEASGRALERAAQIATAFGSKVIVTSVAPVLIAAARGGGMIDPVDGVEEHQTQLQHAKEQLAAKGIDAEIVPGVGDPAQTIVQVADEKSADLIVVGTREPGILDRLLRGSVSQSVSRHAHCDVLVVH